MLEILLLLLCKSVLEHSLALIHRLYLLQLFLYQIVQVGLDLRIHELLHHILEVLVSLQRRLVPAKTVTRIKSHAAQVLRHSHQALYLILLLVAHGFVGVHDLPFLDDVLSHMHDLIHVLVLELYDLLESLLVHSDHLHVLLVMLVLLLHVPSIVLRGLSARVRVGGLRVLRLLILRVGLLLIHIGEG